MNMFKSFAEVKRALTLGSTWECTFQGNNSLGIREVGEVQTNGVGFKTNRDTLSWLYYPKAKFIVLTEGGFDVLNERTGEVQLSYTLLDRGE